MREEFRSHKVIASLLAGWLAVFIAMLFFLGAFRTQARVEVEVILVLNMTVCAALGYMGLADLIVGIELGSPHRREIGIYLTMGIACLASSILLSLTTKVSLGLIAILVSPHAILFGVAQIRLSSRMNSHPTQARALRICGILELACGVCMVIAYRLSDANIVTLLGVTAVFTLLQLFPFLFFSPKSHLRQTM